MGSEFIECARLGLDQRFEEGVEALKQVHGSNPYFNLDKICDDLRRVYSNTMEEFLVVRTIPPIFLFSLFN